MVVRRVDARMKLFEQTMILIGVIILVGIAVFVNLENDLNKIKLFVAHTNENLGGLESVIDSKITLSEEGLRSYIEKDLLLTQEYVLESDVHDRHVYIQQSDIDLMFANYDLYSNEFSVCFKGTYDLGVGKTVYFAVKTFNTMVTKSSVMTSCPFETALRIHSHPLGGCDFSSTDTKTFLNGSGKLRYSGLVCGDNTLIVYDRSLRPVGVMGVK